MEKKIISDLEKWEADARAFEWTMPRASWWKRLLIIRHIRALIACVAVENHYSHGLGSIGLRSGYDDWVLWGIWHGKERP